MAWWAHLWVWQEMPDPAPGGQFSSAKFGVCSHARIFVLGNSWLLAILLSSPTARRLTWYFLKKTGQNTFIKSFFLSSYFTVSAALCLTGAPPCIPPSCQLQPSFPLLAAAPRPGRKNQG